MRRTIMTGLALMALIVSAAGVARPARAEILYTLTDLGTLGGTSSYGAGVNNYGQVAGYAYTAGGGAHAFLSGPNGGPLQDLGTLGGTNSYGYAVNASGQVAGASYTAGNFGPLAFLSGPGGGVLQDLGTLPGGDSSFGYGVNAPGQVAGDSFVPADRAYHAFLSGPNGGPLQDLGTLPGFDSSLGYAVNGSGQVAGTSYNSLNPPLAGPEHAFLSGPGGGPLQDLGTLPGGDYSIGYAVNDAGQVVGLSGTPTGATLAFLYSGGQMLDLNDLIAPGSRFTLESAQGISDTGYIAGYGIAPNGQTHAFLLTPVPEPAGLVLLGTGTVALLAYTARRRARPRA